MSITKPNDFWKLILESGLMTREALRPLHEAYKQVASNGDARGVATWLVKGGHLTTYQARVLLAGRPKAITIGHYQVADRLDQGVLKGTLVAIHKPTGHPVWLHPIASEIQQDPVRWPIVQRMCQLRSAAPHPHLIRCFELHEGSKRSYLVTEQLVGNPLAESRPGEGVPIPAADCARLGRQTTLGAAHIHDQGMVIGDFTIDHLWLEPSGNLKLLHLPIRPVEAIDWASQDSATQLDPLANVAAPELQQPGTAPTRFSDLYAIGALLFDLLTGKPLYTGSIRDRLQQHASAPVPQPPFIPGNLMQVVQYLLSKNPGGRYQHAQDVAEALRPFVDQAQLSPPSPEIPPTLGPYLQQLASHAAPANATPAPVPPGATPAAVPFPGGPPHPMAPPAAVPFPGAPASMAQPVPVQSPVPQPATVQPVLPHPAVGPAPMASAVPGAVPAGEVRPSRASAMTERIRKRKLQRKITSLVVLGIMSVAALVGGIYGYQIMFPGQDVVQDKPAEVDSDPATTVPVNQPPEVEPAPPAPRGPRLVEDDGQTLWVSPTDGEPMDLAGLPDDTRLALVVRMAELLSSPEGDRIVRALGPTFAAVRQQAESDLGIKFDDLESLTLGQGASTANGPPVLIAELGSPTNLLSLWGNPTPIPGTNPPMYKLKGWTVMPLPDRSGQAFIAGPQSALEQVAEAGFRSPQMTRELEQLRRESDASRMVNLLVEPQFLSTHAEQALQGELAAGREAVQNFFGDNLRGVLLSGHLADHLFLEMRCEGSISQTPPMLAQTFKEKILGISRRLEDTIPELGAVPYWRRLALQFPNMVRYAYQHARTGADGNQALVNVVLPASAGQNLVAGTELTLAASTTPLAAAGPAMAATNEPKTIEEKLKAPASISFPQNSLEFALRDIGEQAGIEVEIRGPDLQLDGITRNKEIKNFHHEDKPVGEILADLLVRANPEASEGPGTEVQKLIYVILPQDGPEEEKKIVVTTRAAAARDKYELPEAFQIK